MKSMYMYLSFLEHICCLCSLIIMQDAHRGYDASKYLFYSKQHPDPGFGFKEGPVTKYTIRPKKKALNLQKMPQTDTSARNSPPTGSSIGEHCVTSAPLGTPSLIVVGVLETNIDLRSIDPPNWGTFQPHFFWRGTRVLTFIKEVVSLGGIEVRHWPIYTSILITDS